MLAISLPRNLGRQVAARQSFKDTTLIMLRQLIKFAIHATLFKSFAAGVLGFLLKNSIIGLTRRPKKSINGDVKLESERLDELRRNS